MHPDFVTVGPLTVHMYGVMMALGFLMGIGNWILLGRRDGRSTAFCTDLMFWVMVSGITGARVAYVLENWEYYAASPLTVFRIDQGGLVFYGGFIAAGAALVLYAKRHRQYLPGLLDFVMTSVPLAHAFGRIGCYLNGCCYGGVTGSRFGVCFPRHSLAWHTQVGEGLLSADAARSLAVYPVQLYEAVFNVAVYGILVLLYKRRLRAGTVTAVYLILYAAGRFALEFFRGDHGERLAVGSFSIGQFVSVLILAAGTLIFLAVQGRHTVSGKGDVDS